MINETARKTRLSVVLKIMKNLKLSAEEAMTALEIPAEEQAVLRTMMTKGD